MNNKGITLISLVVVIIVMIILATVSINGILNAGTVEVAKEVAFKSQAKDIKDAWQARIIGINSTFLDYENVTDILSGLNADEEIISKLEIQSGELVYKNEECTQEEKEWFEQVGIFGGVAIVADIKTNVRVINEWVQVKKQQAVDLVILMDLSGSMRFGYNSGTTTLASGEKRRGQIMVNSLNSTINKIISQNPENRISIVGFKNTVTETIPLDKYEYVGTNKNLFTYSYSSKNDKITISSNKVIRSKTNGKNITGVSMTAESGGWTYIQGAMYKAYEILNSKGNDENLPVIMLFSDGSPYPQVYTGSFGSKILTGVSTGWSSSKGISSDAALRGLWTFKTIATAKSKIENCRFYAVNIANYPNKVDRYYSEALLNPNDTTLNQAIKISSKEPDGATELNWMTAKNLSAWAKNLKNIADTNTNKKMNYYYTDGFSIGFVSEANLKEIFDNFIYDIEQNLEKEYTVTENLDGLVGVYTIDSDDLTYTTKKGADGKTEDGTTIVKKYYFKLAEEDNLKITVTAAAYKPSASGGTSSEMISGSEKTIERTISVQEVKDGVDPNLYFLNGTIKWNARGEYKDSDSIAREALNQVEVTGNNVAQIKKIVIELPVRTEKSEEIK